MMLKSLSLAGLIQKKAFIFFLLVASLWADMALAHRPATVSGSKTLVMTTSNGPPYMIEAQDSGFDIDIPRAALKRAGYDLIVKYMPLNRAKVQVQTGKADLTAPIFNGKIKGLFLSEPHTHYRPTVYTMSQRNLSIRDMHDLDKLKILTFQGATGYFGDPFARIVERSPAYTEHHDMSVLPSLLYYGRADAVILDRNIFNYFCQQEWYLKRKNTFTPHDIIAPVAAVVGFQNASIRDQFNRGLRAIKQDGTYDKIIKSIKGQVSGL